MNSEHIKEFFISTFLMVGMYAAFVGLFFFTYGAYTEKKVVKNQTSVLLDELTEDFLFFASQDLSAIKSIQKAVNKITLPDSSEEDKNVNDNNKKLINKAILVLSLILIIFIIISVIIWKVTDNKISYWKVTKKNLFLLFFVIVIEFLFFTLVAQNYRPVDPNKVKQQILDGMLTYSQN